MSDDLLIENERLRQENELLRNENRALRDMAYIDDLTGLPNRRSFWERYRERWSELKRFSDVNLCVAFFDVDNFKSFNTKGGHQEGDRVLRDIGRAIRHVRGYDVFARYGGEEFAGLLYRVDKETGLVIVERIRQSVERLGYGPTVTIGIAGYREDEPRTPDNLVNMANLAMRAGKASGKNRVVAYTPELWTRFK